MDTTAGTASTPRQIIPRNASTDVSLRCPPFTTSLTQVAFVGRAIINAGGCSQRKSKSPGIDGAGGCSQEDLAPTKDCNTQGVQPGGIGDAVGKSGKPKDAFVSRSPVALAASTHVTALSPVAVLSEEAIASGINYRIRNSVAAGSGNTHGRVCHVDHCEEAAFGNMDGYLTVPLCEAHLNDNRRRLRTNADKIKANGKAIKKNVCEYPECTKKPRYSPTKGGPVRACKHHKKAGMFSTRRGKILFVIHDGPALRSAPFSSMGRAPEGNGGMQRLSVTKGQITQLKSPVEAVQLQPKNLTSRPSTPAETSGEKSGALKRKATAATPNATHTGSSASRSVHTSPTLRSSKLSHVTEMVPSAEMNVLQKERGKTMAEASVTGRRPRVPSRKALEASGKLDDDGVQWMTKDMYKAEVKHRKELRERRKEEAAAKMKVDQKVDTLKVRIKVDDPVDVGRAGKTAGGGSTGRGDTSIRGWEKQKLASITLRRRKWSAVKLSQVGARGRASITEQSKGQAEDGGSGEGGSRKRSKTVTEE